MSSTIFRVSGGSNLWKGIARQEHKFFVPLGELIDNSLSAKIKKKHGRGYDPIFVEIIIEEKSDDEILLTVVDNGSGISKEAIIDEKNSIFALGHENQSQGTMNEHGFGLKNAIAMLTSGETKNFKLITKHSGKIYCFSGPLNYDHDLEIYEAKQEDWEKGIEILKDTETGVKIDIKVEKNYFRSVNTVGGGYSFDDCIRKLGEHLGVIYHKFLENNNNEICLRYKGKSQKEFLKRDIPPIPTPFSDSADAKEQKHNVKVEVNGKEFTARYTMGTLNKYVTDEQSKDKLPWPYPLSQYYKGSNARCGLTLVSRGKVLRTQVFKEIWPKLLSVEFNNFLGELEFDDNFPTVNQKNNIDPNTPQYIQVIEKLKTNDDYIPVPSSKVNKKTEEDLRSKIIESIENILGKKITSPKKNKTVWDGGAKIDIYYEFKDSKKAVIYELKVEYAQTNDVYQLEMYWDGLVEEGKEIEEAILVADKIDPNVQDVIDNMNKKRDRKGNLYNISSKLVSSFFYKKK